jgi:hypothetical protein
VHVLVAVADPANLWGDVFTLAAADGSKVSPPRGAGWLVLRDGTPVALAENHGRDIKTLGAWQPSDLGGLVDALGRVLDRPAVARPVRQIEVTTWDDRPVAQTAAWSALRRAGLA